MVLNIFTDGASRGNPGKAGIGVAIYEGKELIGEVFEYVGIRTNNEAEYMALISGIQKARDKKETKVNFFSDSEFLIKQMKGEYKVKAEKIVPLNKMANTLLIGIEAKFHWIPREDNSLADSLANRGIDEKGVENTSKKLDKTGDGESTLLGQEIISRMKGVISSDKKEKKIAVSEQNLLKVDKAFFGKINCLKIQMNNENDIYFHLGLLNSKTKVWVWEKVKMSDSELGEIISVLRKDEAKCSFFHSFSDKKTQIWCNKSKEAFSIKIGDVSKNLTAGEFEVLRIILEKCIRDRNFN